MTSTATRCVPADSTGLEAAARVLNAGGVCVIPTDTVYGLAARPDFPEAVRRLYTIKGRAEQKPIALLAADADAASGFGEGVRVPDHAWTRRLISACGGALRVTSANLSGNVAATDVPQALADVGLSADLVVDDGVSPGGVPSTVARVAPDGSVEILRPGPVSFDTPQGARKSP